LIDRVNWYISAHLVAVISIREGAEFDFQKVRLRDKFEDSEIAKEFYLKSNAENALERDPLSVNRAYRDLRNLRVHFSISIVSLETRILEQDIWNAGGRTEEGAKRWFLRAIDVDQQKALKKPQLSTEEVAKFNKYVDLVPLNAITGQH